MFVTDVSAVVRVLPQPVHEGGVGRVGARHVAVVALGLRVAALRLVHGRRTAAEQLDRLLPEQGGVVRARILFHLSLRQVVHLRE